MIIKRTLPPVLLFLLSGVASSTLSAAAEETSRKPGIAPKVFTEKTAPSTAGDSIILSPITLKRARLGSVESDEVFTGAGSSVYITPEVRNRFGAISAADMLRGQPGVQMGDSRNGGALDVNIRGIQGQGRVKVTVDGSEQSLETYRGYAGTANRSYVDPDLIADVLINKGPSLAPGASGAIGGTVEMRTIGVKDVLKEGKNFGVRVKGALWNNGIEPPEFEKGGKGFASRVERDSFFDSSAKSGSGAIAYTSEYIDFLAAYARREQGNYFAGKKGHERYRKFEHGTDYRGKSWKRELDTVASHYKPGEEVFNTSVDSRSTLLKATIRPTDEHTLDLGYNGFDGRFGEIMGSALFQSKGKIKQWPLGTMNIDSFTALYKYEPADNDLINFKAQAWLSNANSKLLNGGPEKPESTRALTGDKDYTLAHLDNQRWGATVANQSKFDTGLGKLTLDFGGGFTNERLHPDKEVIITEDDWNQNRFFRDGERKEGNFSGKVTLQPTEKLSVHLGGRYIDFSSQDNNRIATPNKVMKQYKNIVFLDKQKKYIASAYWFADANGKFTDATNPLLSNGIAQLYSDQSNVNIKDLKYDKERIFPNVQKSEFAGSYTFADKPEKAKDGGFAPAAGISYNFTPDSLIYANYTEGLRMPGLFETTAGTLMLSPATGLRPEHSRNWEIGLSTLTSNLLSDGDQIGFKLAYFNNDTRDFITRYYNDGDLFFANAESFKTSGLEMQASYDQGRFFTDVSTTYYFHAKTCDSEMAGKLRSNKWYKELADTPDCVNGGFVGSYLNTQNPPKYSVNLTAGVRFFDQALTLGGRMTHTSGPTSELNKAWNGSMTSAQIHYRPVTTFDTFLTYKLREDAELNLSVENIANRYYLDPLSQSSMPAPGRTVRGSLSMKF